MGIFGGGGPRPVIYLFVDAGHLRANFGRVTEAWCGDRVEIDFSKINSVFSAQKVFIYDSIDDSQHAGETVDQQQDRIKAQEVAFRRISALPNTHVRLGSITGTAKKRRQKEVDILIAVEMLNHAVRKNMDLAILLTGDRDFTPLVDALVQFGLNVDVAGDLRTTSDILAAAADNYRPLKLSTYRQMMPDAAQRRAPPLFSFNGSAIDRRDSKLIAEGRAGQHGCELRARGGNELVFVITYEHGAINVVIPDSDLARLKLFVELEYGDASWMPTSI